MAQGPQPLVCGDDWLKVGPPFGAPARRPTKERALQNAKQAIRHLQVALITGEMERNQDVVG